jgi:hypothetical protein
LEKKKLSTSKEQLLLYCNMIRKKVQDPDTALSTKNKGYRAPLRLNPGEWSCLKRGGIDRECFKSFVKK